MRFIFVLMENVKLTLGKKMLKMDHFIVVIVKLNFVCNVGEISMMEVVSKLY